MTSITLQRPLTLVSAIIVLAATSPTRGANLVQYWHFEELGRELATNTVAAGNLASLVNVDTNLCWLAGDVPAQLTFSTASINLDGVDDYIDLGNLGLNGSATLAFWIRPAGWATDMRLFSPQPIPNPYGGLIRADPYATGNFQVNNGGSWFDLASVDTVPAGQWSHMAIAYGQGLLRLYVNGALVGITSASFPFDQTHCCLGQILGASGKTFSGAFDEVSIWDGPLSAAAIQQLAAGAAATAVHDEAVATPAARLVQYFTLDDGAGSFTASNSLPSGNVGNLINFDPSSAWLTSGLPAPLVADQAALAFTAALSNRVDLGTFGLIGAGTVSLWLKPSTNSGDARIYSQLSGTTALPGAVGFVGDGGLQCWDGTYWNRISADGAFPTNRWTHLAVAYANGIATAYVNGTPQISCRSGFLFDTNAFGLGAQFLGRYGRPYGGVIDDVSIWDQALSLKSIQQLATGVSPLQIVDETESTPSISLSSVLVTGTPPVLKHYFPLEGPLNSTNVGNVVADGNTGYLVNYTNGAVAWVSTNLPAKLPRSTMALFLDGLTNYVNLKNLGLSGSGTVSMWINPSTLSGPTASATRRLLSPLSGSGSTRQGALGFNADGTVWVSGSGGGVFTLAPAALTSNRWYHLAVTYSGGTATLFLDGEERWTTTAGFVFASDEAGLGARFAKAYGSTFAGLFDEVAFWNQPLNGSSIRRLANGEVPTNIAETGQMLVLSWPGYPGAFVLQSSASPSGPWANVNRTPTLTGSTYSVTVPVLRDSASQYFRLKKL